MTRHTARALSLVFSICIATVAAAQMGGGIHRGQTPPAGAGFGIPMGGMEQPLVVGSDGVVYVARNGGPFASAPMGEVIAVRPSGVVAWTAKLQGNVHRLEVAGNSLFAATAAAGGPMGRWTAGGTAASTLISLSSVTGSPQWQSSFDGVIVDVEPFAGGTYVLIHGPKRSLAAVDGAGKVSWRIDLD